MSAEQITPSGLYVLSYIRDDPPKSDDFHWALYHHRNVSTGGTKYHIRGISDHWITDHSTIRGVLKELFLVGMFQIAVTPDSREKAVDQALRSLDDTINNGDISCRVWLRRVLEVLKGLGGDSPVVKYGDGEALEREIKDWGNEHSKSAALNEQPRPIGKSRLCGLWDDSRPPQHRRPHS